MIVIRHNYHFTDMAKSRSAFSLLPEAHDALTSLGARLRACRIERDLTISQMAERMMCSINTYRDLEAGKPTASLGNFANALWILGQLDTLHAVAPVPAVLAAGRRAKRSTGKGITLKDTDLDF